jgi:hypothetical protein
MNPMPFFMMLFLVAANGPEIVREDFQTMEACVAAGSTIASNLGVVGLCVDRFTGNIAMFGPREGDDVSPEGKPVPLPTPQEESH